MVSSIQIGITRDFLTADGTVGLGDIGLDLLDDDLRVKWTFSAKNAPELKVDQINVTGLAWGVVLDYQPRHCPRGSARNPENNQHLGAPRHLEESICDH